MENFINYNGKIVGDQEAVVRSKDHSYRYGDGLFETMRFFRGNISLENYHFERLFAGLDALKFNYPGQLTKAKLISEIKQLCERKRCTDLARVRLSVSRGEGGLYDCNNEVSYLIECSPLEQKEFDPYGVQVGIFPDAKKSIDAFSNVKSANYLPYVMAAIWAKENKMEDAFVLNNEGRICDATIANVFWVKDGKIFTPPLSEGCVAGVMRRAILDFNPDSNRDQIAVPIGIGIRFQIEESILTGEILLEADEVFLTNAVTGLRWVRQFRNKRYSNVVSKILFNHINQTIVH